MHRCCVLTEERDEACAVSVVMAVAAVMGCKVNLLARKGQRCKLAFGIQWQERSFHHQTCIMESSVLSSVSFFVQLSVFPGVDKRLISLFAMLAMYSSPILPQTLQQNCETPHSAANKPNNLSATFLLNQWESAPLLATKSLDWEREWWGEFPQ